MRPEFGASMLAIADTLASRTTCCKLGVGCVLTGERGRIVGTGYNGVASGLRHCIDEPCAGGNTPKGSDLCEAIHAEQNALMMVHDIYRIQHAYVSHAPCQRCTKMLLNTSCGTIIFKHAQGLEPQAQDLWLRAGRHWIHYGEH